MVMRKREVPKCIHCGKNLPYHYGPTDQARSSMYNPLAEKRPLTRGVDGRGHFCKKGCAIAWAHRHADRFYPNRAEMTDA
jgi:hypothetical protein